LRAQARELHGNYRLREFSPGAKLKGFASLTRFSADFENSNPLEAHDLEIGPKKV
jgi:hypothetical protein